MKLKMKKIVKRTEFYVFLIIVALSIIIELRSGLFFTDNNIVDITRSMIVPSIYGLCAFLAFVSTGADVSFPLIASLSSYIATILVIKMGYNGPIIFVFLLGAFFGFLAGCLNGFIIVRYKFPSLIVTLATSTICSGVLLGLFQAERTELPEVMLRFGKSALLSVSNAKTGLGATLPMTMVVFVLLYVIAFLVLNYTMVGRGIYAIGGDETAAERAGFNVKALRFGVFAVNGALAGIAGLCYTTVALMYLPMDFAGAEIVVIAAVILGGTRITGGMGTLTGCILGTLLLSMVTNSLILFGINVYWQKFVIGALIIIGTALSARGGISSIGKGKEKEKEALS